MFRYCLAILGWLGAHRIHTQPHPTCRLEHQRRQIQLSHRTQSVEPQPPRDKRFPSRDEHIFFTIGYSKKTVVILNEDIPVENHPSRSVVALYFPSLLQ